MDPERYIQDYYRQRRANSRDGVLNFACLLALAGCVFIAPRHPAVRYILPVLLLLVVTLAVRNKLRIDRFIAGAKQAAEEQGPLALPGVPLPPRMTGAEQPPRPKVKRKARR